MFWYVFISICCFFNWCGGLTLNLIGPLNKTNSLSCHTTSFIHCLYSYIPIILFRTTSGADQQFPSYFDAIIKDSINLNNAPSRNKYLEKHQAITGITIYCDNSLERCWKNYKKLPKKNSIKFAYCVTERTLVLPEEQSILHRLIRRLNTNFDALLVPDQWLVDTFKNVGVSIPIFVLPLALELHSLLEKSPHVFVHKPFVFGFSGGCWPRKNHTLLMKAFAQEFGNNPDVILKIHSRYDNNGFKNITSTHKQINVSNIIIEQNALSRPDYEQFLTSLDCYVTISKGEGFSIIPREVLALGIPCVVSNNTAQTTICNSGCVYAVPSNILEPSTWVMSKQSVGYDYNCSIDDVKKALRSVYENYEHYRKLAIHGREWVKQYLPEHLTQKYRMLVTPEKVILGNCNQITDQGLTTNSKDLFEKYQKLIATQTI